MTAINCNAEQRELQGFWAQTELGLTGEMGSQSRGMYTWAPASPLSLRHSLRAAVSSRFLLGPSGPRLGCRKPGIPDGGSGSRNRACKTPVKAVLSKLESMGKQWPDRS